MVDYWFLFFKVLVQVPAGTRGPRGLSGQLPCNKRTQKNTGVSFSPGNQFCLEPAPDLIGEIFPDLGGTDKVRVDFLRDV